METILQGWLTKSPPEKKQFKLFGSKWRKRYFVLYAPPRVDGIHIAYTAILEYYTSWKLHHKCGSINLADCEEVLSNLDSDIYKHVFGLRTMHKNHLRTYYLAAETETEMNKWVNRLCQVLGLTENDDNLGSPPFKSPQNPRPVTQPMRIPGDTRQLFQRPLTNLAPHAATHPPGAVFSPEPPPLRPVQSMLATPFSRLNLSEPNLLDVSSPRICPETKRETVDDASWRFASPSNSSGKMRNAESFPELDRFSPTSRKPESSFPSEGREFMELPPIPPEKTGTKVKQVPEDATESIDYDQPKQKYYERHDERAKKMHKNMVNSKNDFCNITPPDHSQFMGRDSGLGFSSERVVGVGVGLYNVPHNLTSSGDRVNGSRYVDPGASQNKWKLNTEADDEFYNVPRKQFTEESNDCYNVPKPGTQWSHEGNENQRRSDGWTGYPQDLRRDSDECYNTPRSYDQLSKIKHRSQNEECDVNLKLYQEDNLMNLYNVPREKSDRRSYGGQGWSNYHTDQLIHNTDFTMNVDIQETYDTPKHAMNTKKNVYTEDNDEEKSVYKVLGQVEDQYNKTRRNLGETSQHVDSSLDHSKDYMVSHNDGSASALLPARLYGKTAEFDSGCDLNNIPLSSSAYSSVPVLPTSSTYPSKPGVPKKPARPVSRPSPDRLVGPNQQFMSEATCPVSKPDLGSEMHSSFTKELCQATEGKPTEGTTVTEAATGEEESLELKKSSTGFIQNKSVQSSTSLHRKQPVPGLPIHDSIRFTQRSKSFKRSIPSQDRSALPLPVKRIVERSESSSASSSDDEDEHKGLAPPKHN